MNKPAPKARGDQRSLRNFLLQPVLQIKLGVYSVLLATLFSSLIASTLYVSISDFSEIVFTVTDTQSEIRNLLDNYLTGTFVWVASLVVLFLGSNIALSVVYTHKLVGPTVAFRNHVQKLCAGNFSDRVHLRKGDAFAELADDLNRLTDILEKAQRK